MTDHASKRTIAALEKMIQEMRFLVDNPRMQQKRWVALGRTWLPTLYQAKEDLARLGESAPPLTLDSQEPVTHSEDAILVQISQGKGETYINIKLADIAEVSVARHGEPGHYVQRGATNHFRLKNGTTYLTTVHETQRLVEAMQKREKS